MFPLSRVTLLLLPLFAAATFPSAGRALELISDQPIEFDRERQEMTARGNARLLYEDSFLTANEIVYNHAERIATARGDAIVHYRDGRLIAGHLEYHPELRTAHGENIRFGYFPYFLESAAATATEEALHFSDVNFYLYEPRPLSPGIRASSLTVTDEERIIAENVTFRIGPVPVFYWPSLDQTPRESAADISLGAGYEKTLGTWGRLGVRFPLLRDVRLGADIGAYTRRGVIFGPGGDYDWSGDTQTFSGNFTTGYIVDQGETGTDIFDRDISRHRYFAEWEHQHAWDRGYEWTVRYSDWSDSYVTRDFRRSLFEIEQEPDTFVEGAMLGENAILSVFARARPNDFQLVQERVPELRVDGLPQQIGAGVFQNYQASAANLQERPPGPLETESSRTQRFDAYYGLDRPIGATDWVTITPAAGGRVTHYTRPLGDHDDYTRVLGEVGMDLHFYGHGLFDYDNRFWNINGIRHAVEPKLQYRYIPKAEQGRNRIPQIDRRVFSTHLEPLHLGRVRNIDDLDETHTLRFGLDQYFQTRDPEYGSRDLLAVLIANDLRFSPRPDENTFSDIHSEIVFSPIYWFRLNLFNRIDPEHGELREINTGVTLTDADVWSITVGSDYLEDAIEQYAFRYHYQLNEIYGFGARMRYDARESLVTFQRYSVSHTLQNTWTVEYHVTLRERAQRESAAEFGMSLSMVRF